MNLKDIILYAIVLIVLMVLVIIAINTKFYIGIVFFIPLLIVWCVGVIAIWFFIAIDRNIYILYYT